ALQHAPVATGEGYDPVRGAAVIEAGRAFLDLAIPLEDSSWHDIEGPADIVPGEPDDYIGRSERGVMFCHNGLHIEVVFDRDHPIGRDDPAGIADIRLEAAITTIVDLEDSVGAVDAEDKLLGYRNWLGVIRGDLEASFVKGGKEQTRTLAVDVQITCADGSEMVLSGRSLL